MTAIDDARVLARRAKEERRAGKQDEALATLRSAVGPLEAELARDGAAAAAALADIHGQIGGALREEEQLLQAVAAYDEGYAYETRYALTTTYNALNRVVTRILLCPDALTEPEALRRYEQLPWVDVPAEIERLRDVTAARDQSDAWVVGDFALTSALAGTDPGDALDRLANESDAFVRESYRPIVARLAALDTPRRADLERLARALDEPAPAEVI